MSNRQIHIVIASGKAVDIFSEENAKNQVTECGLTVLQNGLAEDDWWNYDNFLCPECHKKSREKKLDIRKQKFYVMGVGALKEEPKVETEVVKKEG